MQNNNSMRLFVVAGILAAGLAISGAAVAQAGSSEGGADRAAASTTAEPNTSVERQNGVVLEGTGELGGESVMVTVYENSLHGNSIQVVLGDPDDEKIGHAEQAEPFVVDGVLTATVDIQGKPATLTGTVQETGRPEKVVEPIQDAGEQIVTRGTHTQLVTDVVLSFDGAAAPLEFAPAFAYDLEVRRVDLYGN